MWDTEEAFYAIAERAIRIGLSPEMAVAKLRHAWLAVLKHSAEDAERAFESLGK